MSPQRSVYKFDYYSFPRVSGDEPVKFRRGLILAEFSPRERG